VVPHLMKSARRRGRAQLHSPRRAAARPDAAKKRVVINMMIYQQKTFVLTPLQAGPLKSDSGTISGGWLTITGRNVMRDACTSIRPG
jgi:hypothetical protein